MEADDKELTREDLEEAMEWFEGMVREYQARLDDLDRRYVTVCYTADSNDKKPLYERSRWTYIDDTDMIGGLWVGATVAAPTRTRGYTVAVVMALGKDPESTYEGPYKKITQVL